MEKVVVIGAGVAGLSAAIRLQHAGYQVEIYEQLGMPGGKMHQIKVEGHTFDVGPTIVMVPQFFREVFSDVGVDPEDYIPMIRLDPMYDVYFKDEPYRHYSLTSDLVKLMAMAEAKGPDTASGFLKYLSAIYERYQVAVDHFIRRPFRNKSDMYNPFMLRQALKLKTFDSADNMMSQFIPDQDFSQMMSFQTLYIGVSPQNGPSLYNIIPMMELLYGVHFIKGGMHTLAEQMTRLFEELGGKIFYHQKVEEIITDKQKVTGIRVNGQVVASSYVISNADFPYTMTHLIKDKTVQGKYSPAKIESMDYSCSCLVFYWGVDKVYSDLQTHQFIIGEDLNITLTQIFSGDLLTDPSIYLHIPSQVDPSMAPEGKSSFYVLMPVSELKTANYEWTEETINYYREKALENLAGLPELENLREHITVERMFTPEDFRDQFSAMYGATFGLQPTLRQSNHWRPQSKSLTTDGLYFTGSSTHPGAGVPTAMEGGKICAEELRLDVEGANFK